MNDTRVSPRLDCAPNFRDLGGLLADDRRMLRHGRLFRSDMIVSPATADIVTLRRCGIGLVIDLRSASEGEASPHGFLADEGAEVFSFNVGTDVRARGSFWDQLREDSSAPRVLALMHSIYRSIPLAVAPALKLLFERLADGATPVLMHCSAGKDRTGVAVALALHALGVSRHEIEADYLATSDRITHKTVARARKMFTEITGSPIPEDSLKLLTHVRPDYLEHAFASIGRKFGGIPQFLADHAGLTEEMRSVIRDKLLA